MPLYEYECQACGHRFERIRKFADPPLAVCPQCGGAIEKLMSSPAFHLKGSGWYATDYAKATEKTGKDTEKAGKNTESADKTESTDKAGKKEASDSSAKETTKESTASRDTASSSSSSSTSSPEKPAKNEKKGS